MRLAWVGTRCVRPAPLPAAGASGGGANAFTGVGGASSPSPIVAAERWPLRASACFSYGKQTRDLERVAPFQGPGPPRMRKCLVPGGARRAGAGGARGSMRSFRVPDPRSSFRSGPPHRFPGPHPVVAGTPPRPDGSRQKAEAEGVDQVAARTSRRSGPAGGRPRWRTTRRTRASSGSGWRPSSRRRRPSWRRRPRACSRRTGDLASEVAPGGWRGGHPPAGEELLALQAS